MICTFPISAFFEGGEGEGCIERDVYKRLKLHSNFQKVILTPDLESTLDTEIKGVGNS